MGSVHLWYVNVGNEIEKMSKNTKISEKRKADEVNIRWTVASCHWGPGGIIYVMFLTPAEPPNLFNSIILTNPIVVYISQAKPRREPNPKVTSNSHSTLRHRIVVAISHKMAFINPRFVRKSKVLLVLGTLHKNAPGRGGKFSEMCYLL